MDEIINLPLFPLRGVLFPDGVVPLQVFEPRYLKMIGSCLREETGFGICAIRSGSEVGLAPDCYSVGTQAQVIDFSRADNGMLNLVAQGVRRFQILDTEVMPDQLLVGRIRWLDNPQPLFLPETYQVLQSLLQQLLRQAGEPYADITPKFDDADWVVGRLVELLPFALADKQRLLEMDSASQRLDVLYKDLLAETL